ncbi:sigma-70 family RNA polymerase sigma factor [Curtobacterium sp. BRB10]|uniref:sigma-70 family RNA polymerase sigma factor n=1 Tax=Curtobacterium sp. BRB10 TaxID=2962579 RepID=UPI0028813044|nr:sigma-70 family RNA polymerase sigma factor [Curtobacterium sp. BRB10]MDT0235416.1 sigma-70 family RNA polymerase sigma factor [Curtobacterium sp. BRB10]
MPHVRTVDRTASDAFTASYQQYAPELRRFVTTIIIDRHLAEDVVHEAFIEFWRHPDRYDATRADLQSWLRTIAHRRAIDRIRSREASRSRDIRIGIRDHHDIDPGMDRFDALLTRSRLHAALAQLTNKQRDAVVLRYLGERNTSEVADELGTTVGAAKTRIRDGLLVLRAHLPHDASAA